MTGCLATDWYGIKFHTEYEYSWMSSYVKRAQFTLKMFWQVCRGIFMCDAIPCILSHSSHRHFIMWYKIILKLQNFNVNMCVKVCIWSSFLMI